MKKPISPTWRRHSHDAPGNPDVRVGNVQSVSLDVVQTILSVHARDRISIPIHIENLERTPRPVLRRQIGTAAIFGAAEDTARAPEKVNFHVPSLNIAGVKSMIDSRSRPVKPINRTMSALRPSRLPPGVPAGRQAGDFDH
jgi:hypothetical protein